MKKQNCTSSHQVITDYVNSEQMTQITGLACNLGRTSQTRSTTPEAEHRKLFSARRFE